jgi:hypothetical protein
MVRNPFSGVRRNTARPEHNLHILEQFCSLCGLETGAAQDLTLPLRISVSFLECETRGVT